MRDFPSQEELKLIAYRDPRIAYMLLAGPRMQLQVLTASASFPSGSTVDGTPIPATLDQQLPEEFYVVDLAYQVATPNANAGSLFKGQQDYYNALSPGIDAQIQVTAGIGGVPYVVNDEFAPIEGLARHTDQAEGGSCSWANGWPLGLSSTVLFKLVLTRAYTAAELPCNVTFFLRSHYMACASSQISRVDAVAGLAGYGIQVPERPKSLFERG